MAVAFCIMRFGPLTSATFDPARILSPAIAAGEKTEILPYLIDEFAGVIFATLLYNFFFWPR